MALKSFHLVNEFHGPIQSGEFMAIEAFNLVMGTTTKSDLFFNKQFPPNNYLPAINTCLNSWGFQTIVSPSSFPQYILFCS